MTESHAAMSWGARLWKASARPEVAAVLLLAALLVSPLALLLGLRKAVWLRVEVPGPQRPALSVIYNQETDRPLPVIWDILNGKTWVAIRPLDPGKPVMFTGLGTEKGEVPNSKLNLLTRWERTPNATGVALTKPEVVYFNEECQEVTPRFAAGPQAGRVEVSWLDQRAVLDLSSQPAGEAAVSLRRTQGQAGWVLLPPVEMTSLALVLKNAPSFRAITRVTLFASEERSWSGQELASVMAGQDSPAGAALPGLEKVNAVSPLVWLGLWLGLAALGLLFLRGVSLASAFLARRSLPPRPLTALDSLAPVWTLGRVSLVVFGLTLAFHLAYALFTPMTFSPDSTGYYAWARNFLHTRSLDDINPYRTPGYPLLYALVMAFAGEQVLALVVFQHLGLALLGPLTVRFLYPRTNPLFAGLGGLLAGLCPMLSITASVVWTESCVAFFACCAVYVFLGREDPGWRRLVCAGFLAGLAAMIKPNMIVLPGLMAGQVALRWWLGPTEARRLGPLALRLGLVAGGWLLVSLPWLVYLHTHTGQWDMTALTKTPKGQDAGQMNIFKHAAYVLMLYHAPAPEELEVNRPYREVMSMATWNRTMRKVNLPARHACAYSLVNGNLIHDARLPMESFRENIRKFTLDYLDNVRVAFQYGLLHLGPGDSPHLIYPELQYAYGYLKRSYPLPTPAAFNATSLMAKPKLVPEEVTPLMEHMAHTWMPPASPLRYGLLWLSSGTAHQWQWVAMTALAGLIAGLFQQRYRGFGFMGLFWMVIAAGPAVIGVGAERYTVVCEPLFYVMSVPLLDLLTRPFAARASRTEGEERP